MKRYLFLILLVSALLVVACAPVDLNASVPVYETGIDPNAWVTVPAGEFLAGQHSKPTMIDYDYEIMVTDVTVAQYVEFLNAGTAQDYIYVPLNDPSSRFDFDGSAFTVKPGYENHPMANVSWFGARGYCLYYDYRLPTELEWEKAARGTDGRAYPWGWELARNNANFYTSRDPFEDMSSFGSRTTPVGFYNGKTYDGYVTLDSASPYGLYDMAGNVWQWTANIYEQMHYRFMRGGSKDTYDNDLRVWVRSNATPTYYGPGVGFRCLRTP